MHEFDDLLPKIFIIATAFLFTHTEVYNYENCTRNPRRPSDYDQQ